MPTAKIGQRYRNRRSGIRVEVIGFTRKGSGGIRRAKLRRADGSVTFHVASRLGRNYKPAL